MNLKSLNPKSRFSEYAEIYEKYRPSYPREIIDYLNKSIGLNKSSIIADIGSGTGISTKLFLDNDNTIYAVEPNQNMREKAEQYLKSYSNFCSIDGSSEETNLQSESIDIIVAAQAFHWFDPIPTKNEFIRILKPNGYIVLLSNYRKYDSEGFMSEYLEIIKKYSEKYTNESTKNSKINFFDSKIVYEKTLPNPIKLDFENFKGLSISYSYMPKENDSRFISMISELKKIYDKYEENGQVTLKYETSISYSKIK